jgi:hypothetical protein
MECSDILRPSRRASLPSLGDTLRCACHFAPVGPERQPRAWGSFSGPHYRTWYAGRRSGLPRFLRGPGVPMPCSSTPAGPTPQAIRVRRRGSRPDNDESYPRRNSRGSMARPWHALSTLRGADCSTATQDSLLAAGLALPGRIGYPQDPTERFPICVLHLIPLSQACLAQCQRLRAVHLRHRLLAGEGRELAARRRSIAASRSYLLYGETGRHRRIEQTIGPNLSGSRPCFPLPSPPGSRTIAPACVRRLQPSSNPAEQ